MVFFAPMYFLKKENLVVYWFNFRVTLFEAGIITTPFMKLLGGETPATIYPKVADGIPDEEMRKIVKDMLSFHSFKTDLAAGGNWQEPEELAKQIENIIMCEKPDFRHQTSESVKNLAKQQFVDPTGNVVMDAWLKFDS